MSNKTYEGDEINGVQKDLENKFLNFIKTEDRLQLLERMLDYSEIFDVMKVFVMGDSKYGVDSWLQSDGPTMSIKSNFDSMSHHMAKYYCQDNKDSESGLDHRLHIACRALMSYVRYMRDIQHKDDPKLKTQSRKVELDDSNCKSIDQHLQEQYNNNSQYFYGTRPEDKNE